MNIIIFDINENFVNEAKRLEKYGIKVIKMDVTELINQANVTAVVSPANSFGFMDGGIDKVYMGLFPGIQQTVQQKIKSFGLKTNLGRDYLPIGSAITVPTNNQKCPYLISSPTMFFPGNIKGTNNICASFIAILYILKKNNGCTIACPGLGTGVGMVEPKDAVDQIEIAINNYDRFIGSNDYQSLLGYCDNMNIVFKKMVCKQPNNYANSEIP